MSATFFHNDFRNIVSFASADFESELPCVRRQLLQYGQSPRVRREFDDRDQSRVAGCEFSGTTPTTIRRCLRRRRRLDDPRWLPGNRLFKRPLHSANLIANAHFRANELEFRRRITSGGETDSDFDSTFVNGVCT